MSCAAEMPPFALELTDITLTVMPELITLPVYSNFGIKYVQTGYELVL